MTSNPVSLGLRDSSLELTQQVHPTQSPHSILQSNQSSLSLNGYNGPEQGHGTPGQGQAQYGGQQGVNGQSGSAAAMQHAPRPPSAPPTTYPWSTRPLRLFAPQTSPPIAPQSPFPRYGLSVPGFPSHSGHMLIFGGLVHENVRNDLWSMDVRDCTTMSVKTKGDSPMPRVGHASAIADRIMIVWGGDTKVKPEDKQDEGLYILDLRELPHPRSDLRGHARWLNVFRHPRVDTAASPAGTSWTIRSRRHDARYQILRVWRTGRRRLYERSLVVRHSTM